MTVKFTTANGDELIETFEANEELEDITEKLEEVHGAGILITDVEI